MQKFKLRSNDLDTLYSIFKHSSLTPLDIKQLRQNKFFYTYTPRRAMERNERVFVRVADTFDDNIQDIQDTGCCHICREVSYYDCG